VAIFRKDDKIGLLGTDGKLILEPKYDIIKKFWNGHAKVKSGELWGIINQKGEVIIPAEYNELGTYNTNGVWGRKGDNFGIVLNGKLKVVEGADKIWNFHDNSSLTYARKNKKWGFVNQKGEWVIQPAYDKAKTFVNGLAPVSKGKIWGYINEKGEEVISFDYRDAEIFAANGLAPVKDKKWGFINTTGNLVIPMEYDITAGLSFIMSGFKKGFINGLARVKSKKGWGFINEKGEVLGGKWYKNAENFVNTQE